MGGVSGAGGRPSTGLGLGRRGSRGGAAAATSKHRVSSRHFGTECSVGPVAALCGAGLIWALRTMLLVLLLVYYYYYYSSPIWIQRP
jgi:hypothetical protein